MLKYSKDAWAIFKVKPWQLREEFSKKNAVDRGKTHFQPQTHSHFASQNHVARSSQWNALKMQVAKCSACSFYEKRQNMVFGKGHWNAPVMIIGDVPSQEDNLTGEPFSGQNGQMLSAMLQSIGLAENCCFVTLAMKCKAEKPSHSDIVACRAHLMQQIQLLKPKVILLLGKTAAFSVLDDSRDIKELRENVFMIENAHTLVSFHPGHLFLKPEDKKWVWLDLLRFKALLAQKL